MSKTYLGARSADLVLQLSLTRDHSRQKEDDDPRSHRRPTATSIPAAFTDHYRCPSDLATFGLTGQLSSTADFFKLGDIVCYGRRTESASKDGINYDDVSRDIRWSAGRVCLPFDFSEVVSNLRLELYDRSSHRLLDRIAGASRGLYYFLRPFLSVSVRKHLQRASLRGWEGIQFPRWPVDFTVEMLMEHAMMSLLRSGLTSVPFIWFWPDGAPSCAVMTHDVESKVGRDFCEQLMDLDDSHEIKSAFQLVPEDRYEVTEAFLETFRRRGFETNVHDLNHDGQLFQNREQFLERVERINAYGRRFQTKGFRAGTMYRRQEWFDAFEFSYDMSVPNVAHLEPQRGGCCTVTPYFVGKILELPLTTLQDHSLFNILGDYSINLWKTQIQMISARHGLISFITHPDYLIETRARAVYSKLLVHLQLLRDQGRVWMTLPAEVDRWWRSRSRMTLVRAGDSWRIEGPDCHRARIAFARLENDRVVYDVQGASASTI